MVLNADCSTDVLEQIKRQGLTFPFSKFWFYIVEMFRNRMCIALALPSLRCSSTS